jgi:hypothetical protein
MLPDDSDLPLIDRLYRLTYGKPCAAFYSNKRMRYELTQARRFLLDDNMSAFLADIDIAGFHKRSDQANIKAVETMRRMARVPHSSVWVEYDFTRYNERESELSAGKAVNYEPAEGVYLVREGWLLQNCPTDPLEQRAFIFQRQSKADADRLWWFPFGIYWRCDENSVVSGTGVTTTGEAASDAVLAWSRSAIIGIRYGQAGIDAGLWKGVSVSKGDQIINCPDEYDSADTHQHNLWWGPATGVLRRIWAFLSAVDDIPVLRREARTSRGFTARAQYRRYLEHKILTLRVPQPVDMRLLARSIMATAKRRQHMVRGHWRKDWRAPLSALCDHDFETRGNALHCKICHGQQLFIKEHSRGDPSIGIVTHDYEVVH